MDYKNQLNEIFSVNPIQEINFKKFINISKKGIQKKIKKRAASAKTEDYYVDISVNQAKQFLGKRLFDLAVKYGTEVATEQIKDWPRPELQSKVCVYGAASIYFYEPKIILYGGLWLKDGHQSSVSADLKIKFDSPRVSEDGING